MSIDKLAPQSVEAEQSVLGSILIDADAILRVGDFLKPGDFYRVQHGEIYEAMLALHGQREQPRRDLARRSPACRIIVRATKDSLRDPPAAEDARRATRRWQGHACPTWTAPRARR